MRTKIKKPRFPHDYAVGFPIAEAIGRVIIQWGIVEDSAGILTARLLGADHHDFRTVSANMMGSSKLDTLEAVARLKLSPRKAATIIKIAKVARGLNAERNRIVHGCWLATGKPHIALRHAYRAFGSLSHHREEVSASRLLGHAAEVARIVKRLNYALERAGAYSGRAASP